MAEKSLKDKLTGSLSKAGRKFAEVTHTTGMGDTISEGLKPRKFKDVISSVSSGPKAVASTARDLRSALNSTTEEESSEGLALTSEAEGTPASEEPTKSIFQAASSETAPTESEESTASPLSTSLSRMSAPDLTGLSALQDKREKLIESRDVTGTQQNVLDSLKKVRESVKVEAEKDPFYQQYAQTIREAQQEVKNSRQAMRDEETKTGWLSAVESIGQALTQYAAAKYGMAHGVNLAGLKMEKTDWEKILARTQARLQNEIADLQDLRKDAEKGQAGIRADLLEGGKLALKEGLDAEEKKFQQELGAVGSEIDEEKFKISKNLEVAKENNDQAYREQELAAKKVAAAGAQSPQFKKLQQIELADQTLDRKKLDARAKSLQLIRGAVGGTEGLTGKDLKKKIPKLREEWAAAGLNPAEVTQAEKILFGFAEKEVVDQAGMRDILNGEEAKLDQQRDSLDEYRTLAAQANSTDDLTSLRNTRLGKTSASPAQLVSPGQAAPQGGKIRVRRKGDGATGSVLPSDFDPSKYDKI